MLYLLDFVHIRETGLPVLWMEYLAGKAGPIPERYREIQTMLDSKEKVSGLKPTLEIFSQRELRIMRSLVKTYQTDTQSISEKTHLGTEPWKATLLVKGINAPINYALAVDPQEQEKSYMAEESVAVIKNFSTSRSAGQG